MYLEYIQAWRLFFILKQHRRRTIKMMYDVEALLDEADSLSVANYLGMEVVKKGSNYCIPCPGHEERLGKPDRKIGNCILTPKGYHCFACCERVGLINMVMEYTGCQYKEALTIIGDACGGAELFVKNGQIRKKQPLSQNDLTLIGLKPYCGKTIYETINSCKYITEVPKNMQYTETEKGELLVTGRKEGFSLEMLFELDEKSYNSLILRKSQEAIAKYEAAIKNFGFRDAPGANTVYELLNEDGCLQGDCFTILQKTLQTRLWRAQEIYEEFKDRH